LPENQDPKLLFAKNLGLKVDVNNAKYEELIKVPGIGLKAAKNILDKRPIKDVVQLKKCGVLGRALPFIYMKRDVQKNLNFWK